MYTFTQLLIRNALYGLAIFICVAIASIVTFQSYLNEQQIKHQHTITTVSQKVLQQNDVKTLAQLLSKSNDYKSISITALTGETVAPDYSAKGNLLADFITPKSTKVTIDNNIIIEFQLSAMALSSLIMNLQIAFFAFTLLLVFILSLVNKQQYHQLFIKVCSYIKAELAVFTGQAKKADSADLSFNIPELKAGLESIKAIIDAAEQQSSVLKEEAYVDHLTHIANRNGFIQFFQTKISQGSEIKFGVMLITRCSELQTINKIHGYKEGDNYIGKVASIIKTEIVKYKGAEIFRLNSSDFATIIPNITLKEAEKYAQSLTTKFNDYQESSDLDSVAYTGLVSFEPTKPLGEILALIDTAISVAQTQQVNAWYSQNDTSLLNNPSVNYGNQNWRQEIESVLENQRIYLVVQPIQTNKS